MRKMLIIIFFAIVVVTIIVLNLLDNRTTNYYILEEVTVAPGDTFWGYYNEGYYADMNYSEALYNWKKDNNKTNSKIIAGETIILRKVANENK